MIQLVSRQSKITQKSKQRIYYSDFPLSFERNPVTKNIVILTNEDSVTQAFRNLIFLKKGEKFYHNNIGGSIEQRLFEPMDDVTTESIKEDITTALKEDSRASDVKVSVIPYPEQHYYDVTIEFTDIHNQVHIVNFPLTQRIR